MSSEPQVLWIKFGLSPEWQRISQDNTKSWNLDIPDIRTRLARSFRKSWLHSRPNIKCHVLQRGRCWMWTVKDEWGIWWLEMDPVAPGP